MRLSWGVPLRPLPKEFSPRQVELLLLGTLVEYSIDSQKFVLARQVTPYIIECYLKEFAS